MKDGKRMIGRKLKGKRLMKMEKELRDGKIVHGSGKK